MAQDTPSKPLKIAEKASHSWFRWIILGVITIGVSYFLASTYIANNKIENALPGVTQTENTENMTEQEKIDAWIIENNLNEYGDPMDTAYAGGSPLFNEGTGEYMDRYDYIISQHPDKPWNN